MSCTCCDTRVPWRPFTFSVCPIPFTADKISIERFPNYLLAVSSPLSQYLLMIVEIFSVIVVESLLYNTNQLEVSVVVIWGCIQQVSTEHFTSFYVNIFLKVPLT